MDYSIFVERQKQYDKDKLEKQNEKHKNLGLKKNNPTFKMTIHLVAKFHNGSKYIYETDCFEVTGNDEKIKVENRFIDNIHKDIDDDKFKNMYLKTIYSNGKPIAYNRYYNNILL